MNPMNPAGSPLPPMRTRSHAGFTLVEVVIALTIVVIIAAASIPSFKGMRDEQLAREPIQELVRLAKQARLRAMKEKRPYQVAFASNGFTASRYFNPYLQLSELTQFLEEDEAGTRRINPNEDEEEKDLDSSANTLAKRDDLALAPPPLKLDDNWHVHYDLPPNTRYTLEFWQDLEPTIVEGDVVKLWVFQPSGICRPLKIHLERETAVFDVEFASLTADIVKEAINVR